MPKLEEIERDFAACLESGLVTNNSANLRRFEEKLQDYFGSAIRPSVNCNGELALFHLIQAWKAKLRYGPHDTFEVLVPSFTFSGTINAIVTNNLKPVFCDVDEHLVVDLAKAVVDSPEIKMIVAVGAYGNLVNLDELQRFAATNKLVVVLDNAPAFGSRFKGAFPSKFGFSEMLSFHATKIFNSMEGGATIVHNQQIADHLVHLRDFGQFEKVRGDVDLPGLNSKMTEICALVGLRNLEKIDYILSTRARNAARYLEFFSGLEARGQLRMMKVDQTVTCPYLYFPIILNEEATPFVEWMGNRNVAVRRYYTATHELSFYRGRYREQNLGFTDEIKDKVVALPLHTIMSDEEIEYLFDSVQSYFAR